MVSILKMPIYYSTSTDSKCSRKVGYYHYNLSATFSCPRCFLLLSPTHRPINEASCYLPPLRLLPFSILLCCTNLFHQTYSIDYDQAIYIAYLFLLSIISNSSRLFSPSPSFDPPFSLHRLSIFSFIPCISITLALVRITNTCMQ